MTRVRQTIYKMRKEVDDNYYQRRIILHDMCSIRNRCSFWHVYNSNCSMDESSRTLISNHLSDIIIEDIFHLVSTKQVHQVQYSDLKI